MKREISEQYSVLNKLEKKVDELYHRLAMQIGISDSTLWILYSLYEIDEAITQNDIAESMGVPKQTINSAISGLLKNEYVYLEQKAVARNSKMVHLSEKGKEFCIKFIMPIMKAEEKACSGLTDEEMDAYLSLSKKLSLFLQKELGLLLETMGGESK